MNLIIKNLILNHKLIYLENINSKKQYIIELKFKYDLNNGIARR